HAGEPRRASFLDIFDWLPAHFFVIARVVVFIEAKFYLRKRTHGVHPDGTVSDRDHRQNDGGCSQERSSQEGTRTDCLKCQHRVARISSLSEIGCPSGMVSIKSYTQVDGFGKGSAANVARR